MSTNQRGPEGCVRPIIRVTLISTHDLSLFSLIVRHSTYSDASVHISVALPLLYICGCAYFSLFRLGIKAVQVEHIRLTLG